jgi:hypothetical protein
MFGSASVAGELSGTAIVKVPAIKVFAMYNGLFKTESVPQLMILPENSEEGS